MPFETSSFQPSPQAEQLPGSLIRQVYQMVPPGVSCIDLGLGELKYPMPLLAREAAIGAIDAGRTLYTPNAGLPELRKAIAMDFSNSQGVPTSLDNTLVTVGSSEALFVAFATFLAPGDEVLIPAIHYPTYKTGPQLLGAKVNKYRLNGSFIPDIDDIAGRITNRTKLIVLNSPSNPTGQVTLQSTIEELAKVVENHLTTFVLSDEIYSSYVYGSHNISPATIIANTVVIDGMSKRASMTGARLGWMLGAKNVIDAATKVHSTLVSCAPTNSQYAALAVLEGVKETQEFKDELTAKRSLVMSLLDKVPGISYKPPQGAFYAWVDVSNYGPSMKVVERLIKEGGVITTPGLAFGEAGNNYIRISFAASRNDIQEGLDKVKEVFEKWD